MIGNYDALKIEPGKKYIDATVGGGGHGIEIVRRGGLLFGIDTDKEAIEQTKKSVQFQMPNAKLGQEIILKQGNFRDIKRLAKENGFEQVDGILFDLGVSSHQLDTPERGFSYRFINAPLDMRLDQSKGVSAQELLQTVSEEELYEIFAKFGEEEHSRTIAHAIVRARQVSSIATTRQLLFIIEKEMSDKRHVQGTASRVFQALRIAVNDELSALREGLLGAFDLLYHGGRIVVISFHSLEDRIVKQTLQSRTIRILTKKPILATSKELYVNIRSRSAKLRIGEKL